MIIRKHYRITGRVQGVGFRYRARHAANFMGITGWVKNQYDGSVELEAQGTETQMNQMLAMINKSEYILIESVESVQIPLEEDESAFHIR